MTRNALRYIAANKGALRKRSWELAIDVQVRVLPVKKSSVVTVDLWNPLKNPREDLQKSTTVDMLREFYQSGDGIVVLEPPVKTHHPLHGATRPYARARFSIDIGKIRFQGGPRG